MRTVHATRFEVCLLLLLGLLFTSCEGNTRLDWRLNNQSSSDLYVIHKAWDYANVFPDTLFVGAGEELILGTNDLLGGNSQAYAPASFIDTLFILNSSGAYCTKDWQETAAWEIQSEQVRKIPSNWEHIYRLSVDDGDF